MKSALIVIDVQRYFFEHDAEAFLKSASAIIPNLLKLIDAFRSAGLPIVFTRHAHKMGEPTGQMGKWWNEKLPYEGTCQADFTSEIVPMPGDLVITKTRYSAFEMTDLDVWLCDRNVTIVVLVGVMTNLCVETTARHAFMKDFQPVIVEDACAANTTRHHKASILNLSYGFARIVKTDDVIGSITDISLAV